MIQSLIPFVCGLGVAVALIFVAIIELDSLFYDRMAAAVTLVIVLCHGMKDMYQDE